MAQQDSTAVETPERIRGVQYVSNDKDSNVKQPLFAGFSVSGNLMGMFLVAFTSNGEIEGAVRLNLHEKYYPIG